MQLNNRNSVFNVLKNKWNDTDISLLNKLKNMKINVNSLMDVEYKKDKELFEHKIKEMKHNKMNL